MAVPFVPPEHVSCGVGDVRAVFARVLPHPDVLAVDVVSDDVDKDVEGIRKGVKSTSANISAMTSLLEA